MSLKQWNILHGASVSAGIIVFHITGLLWPLPVMALISLVILWTSQWNAISKLKPAGGYGNLVTGFRYLLVVFILFISGMITVRSYGISLIVPVLLDVADGYLARHRKQVSGFGMLFDLETDSLLVASAGLILYNNDMAGAWILPPVYMRYVYLFVLVLFRLNGVPEKRTRFGPMVAGIMNFSLLYALILPSFLSRIILFISGGMIVASFGYSFFDVLKRRNALI